MVRKFGEVQNFIEKIPLYAWQAMVKLVNLNENGQTEGPSYRSQLDPKGQDPIFGPDNLLVVTNLVVLQCHISYMCILDVSESLVLEIQTFGR